MDDEDKYWSNLEKVFVHNVYERISSKYDEFNQMRYKRNKSPNNSAKNDSSNEVDSLINNESSGRNKNFKAKNRKNEWPKVRQFILQIEPYSLIADVGCGEGKYLNINSHILSIGSDRSSSLCQLATYKDSSNSITCNKNQIIICDNLTLPFRSNLFDVVISIGVIHHLSTLKRRIKAVQELTRILKPGGKMMIYVWAMEQRLRKFKCQDVLVPMLNTNISNSKSEFKLSLRRDLSNNSAANSEDSNDESLSDKLLNSLGENTPTLQSPPPIQNSFTFRQDSAPNETNKEEEVKFELNQTEIEPPPNTPKSPFIPNQKSSFIDCLKRFFSQKMLYNKEESNRVNTHVVKSSPNLIKTNSIEDPNSIERYKRIIDDHKDVLPENFTIRQFPNSSCQDTFESIELNEESKTDVTSSLSPSPTSTTSSSNFVSNSQNENETLNTSNLSNSQQDDMFAQDSENNLNKRFYHVFRKNELDNLIKQYCPELIIYDSYYDHGNWSICARKEKSTQK